MVDPRNTLLARVREFWEREPCGVDTSTSPPGTQRFFDDLERHRYSAEPEILSFAGFESTRGRHVLEVGIGAGTDFVRWVRGGALATGMDLTIASAKMVRARLSLSGLSAPLCSADAEHLPFSDDSFDVVYSWGVLHHTPDTRRAVSEVLRVTRPGCVIRLMLYNRRSLFAFWLWVRTALLRGRPWRSFTWVLANDLESPGTKGYTPGELTRLLEGCPASGARFRTVMTHYDRLGRWGRLPRLVAAVPAAVLGNRAGWFHLVEIRKAIEPSE